MPAADLLALIAQIAVALAGFSGLIAALRTTSATWHPRDIWSLSWMLGASIGALLLALLPLWFGLLDPGGARAWRLACVVAGLSSGTFAIVMTAWGRRLTRRGFPRRVPGVPATLCILLAVATLVDLIAATSAFGARLVFAYVGSLLLLLVAALLALCVFLVLLAREVRHPG
ncbi:hypothetical protein LVB87_09795 [Lysobacter sp. KIS68-7]|uniref:hypothetical protein n=1 Tax=Lysobacter sp. KIS68-7 TaxID=2904252 RepID=UPI001E5C2FBD|nr:hypothetical protein [Lysobacter sp. KIS68-7]UHQ18503.1 hypothetical protein LVB87_09795 [Lysobacter sp. KIS68-7]